VVWAVASRLSPHPFAPSIRTGNNEQQRKERPAMQVFVRDNDINSALRVLKKKMQREGTFREMKRRRAYEKPSERRAREQAEAVRRHRKMLRKRLEREGY
jgi:small subunit ribosomal protein S21